MEAALFTEPVTVLLLSALLGCGGEVPNPEPMGVPGAEAAEPAPAAGPAVAPADEAAPVAATFRGGAPAWVRGLADRDWIAVAVPNPRGMIVVWWNPETGEQIEASRRAIWPADTACDVAASGLVCVKGGDLVWVPFPGDESAVPATATVGAARAVHAAASGKWVALVGEGIRVVDPAGKPVWEGPGPVVAAGWHEDRLVWADAAGAVHELTPPDATGSLGNLPSVGPDAAWTVSPAGAFAVREGAQLLRYPPGPHGTEAFPIGVELPSDVQGIDWLGPERFVARTPAGLHVYVEGKRAPLAGELTDGAPAAWP